MTTFRIEVVIDPTKARRGLKQVDRGLQSVNKSADRTNRLLKRAFAFAGVFVGIRALISMSDAAIEVRNRIRIVTDSTEELNGTLVELAGIAKRTRTSLAAMALLFQRGSIAAKELGTNNEELLEFVERVGLGLGIQGSSAATARGALIQLSQALGSTIVRAEEFNAILEGAFPIAQAVAKGLDRAGDSVARLRRLVIDGKVSSTEFFRAFLKGSEDFGTLFAKTVPTIGQAFTRLRDSFILALDDLNETSGVLGAISNSIIVVANNLGTAAKVAATLALTLGGAPIARAIAGVLGLTGQVTGLTVALNLARVAAKLLLRALLIGFVIELAVAFTKVVKNLAKAPVQFKAIATVAIDKFVNAIINGFIALGRGINNLIRVVTDPIALGLAELGRAIPDLLFRRATFEEVSKRITDVVSNSFRTALTRVGTDFEADMNRRLVRIASDKDLADVAIALAGGPAPLAPRVTEEEERRKKLVELTKKETSALDRLRNKLDPIGAARRELAKADVLLTKAMEAGSVTMKERTELLDKLRISLQDQLDPLGAVKRELAEERKLLSFNSEEREVQADLLERIEGLRKAGIVLSRAGRNALADDLRSLQLLNDETDREDALLRDIRGPLKDYRRDLSALNRLLATGKINTEEFTLAQRKLRLAALESARTMESGFERGLLRLADQFGDVASVAENSLVSAFQAAEDAAVEFFNTGKIGFKELVDSIRNDITRLAVRQVITAPLAEAIGGAGAGSGGFLGSLFGGGGGLGGGLGGIFGGLRKLLPFVHGGGFQVAGVGGVDKNVLSVNNQPVAKVSRGETVSVSPEGGGGRPITININVPPGQNAESFVRSQDQIISRGMTAARRAEKRNR